MKGNICISRTTSNREESYISIILTDELSGCRFVTAEMKLEDFAQAITGMGYMDIEFDLYPQNVGKVREHKIEQVTLPESARYKTSEEIIEAAVAPFEVDGWKAYRKDLGNHHNWVTTDTPGQTYRVSFVRYVDKSLES